MLISVLIILTLLVIVYNAKKRKGSPPGPWNIPLVGQALVLDRKHPERTMISWAEQYGPVCSVQLFGQDVVLISDPKLIREAFNMSITANRRETPALDVLRPNEDGVTFSNGSLWRESRRFIFHQLKNFGMGKNSLEDAIVFQANEYITKALQPNLDQPINIDERLGVAVVNVLYCMLTSETLDIYDQRSLEMIQSVSKASKIIINFFLANYVPAFGYLPERVIKLKEFAELFDLSQKFMEPTFAQHKLNINPEKKPEDLMESFLLEQREHPEISDGHILNCASEMLFAGIETTFVTLKWAFCFLCCDQTMQQLLHEELDAIIGQHRQPKLSDRLQMPLMDAFLHETQRLGDVIPLGLQHYTTEDFQLGGYTIHAGSIIISLLGAVHKSEKYFPDALQFRPQRYIDAETGQFRPHPAVMPFSTGRRQCVGEALARSQLFLFTCAILQRFSLSFPNGFQHDLSINEDWFGNEPSLYKMVVRKRKNLD